MRMSAFRPILKSRRAPPRASSSWMTRVYGSGRREPERDFGPCLLEGGCSHEQPEVRARYDFRTDLMTVTANKMSGGQQLFGRNNFVSAARSAA
jgi:hypothetical protein